MNISKSEYNNCVKLKELLEKCINKEVLINDLPNSCKIINIDEKDKINISICLQKKNYKLSPLFYK